MEFLKSLLAGTLKDESQCMKDENIHLDVQLNQQYKFKELSLYLKHHRLPYQEYIEICSNAEIIPVLIEDCPAVIDYIENYSVPAVHYDDITYSGNKDYSFALDWITDDRKGLTTNENNKFIIVPENIRSLLNILNIEEFISNKRVKNIEVEDLFVCDDSREISIGNKKFTVVNSADKFTSEDWNNLACIFLDGTLWQYKLWTIRGLVEIFDKVPCFYAYYKNQHSDKLKGYNVTELVVDDKNQKLLTDVNFEHIINKY